MRLLSSHSSTLIVHMSELLYVGVYYSRVHVLYIVHTCQSRTLRHSPGADRSENTRLILPEIHGCSFRMYVVHKTEIVHYSTLCARINGSVSTLDVESSCIFFVHFVSRHFVLPCLTSLVKLIRRVPRATVHPANFMHVSVISNSFSSMCVCVFVPGFSKTSFTPAVSIHSIKPAYVKTGNDGHSVHKPYIL